MRVLASGFLLHFVAFVAIADAGPVFAATSKVVESGSPPYAWRRMDFGPCPHCGAFENWPRVLASLAARGSSPAAAHDMANAVRWLRSQATHYSIDKQRIGIWGVESSAFRAELQARRVKS